MIAERIYNLLPADWPKVIGDLPATNSVAVGIMEYDGATSTEYFGDRNTSSLFSPIIKIVIRHTSYEIGQQWATAVRDTLHRYHDDTLLSVLLVGAPMYLGRSAEKLHEFQVTFRTQEKE
ncbi:MAG: minor capsid protein [Prevotella sp.]